MNQAEALARAAKAKSLLDDPLLSEAFGLAEKAIFDKFRGAPDDAQVIRAKQLLTALTLVRRILEQAVSDGKVAERTLEDERRGVSYLEDLGKLWTKRKR